MWTWERERRREHREQPVQLGRVTLSGETAAANLGGERRWLNVCAPGGFQWRPKEGQQVLILKPETGEQSCVLGTVEPAGDLQPGQVRLTGGNCVLFLGDRLELTGDVTVNGETLEDLIRRIAAEGATGE